MDSASLALQIRSLMVSSVAEQVERRIEEFKALHLRGNEDWFSELCFCILTAYSSAKLGIHIQSAIGVDGFLNLPEKELASRLRQLGHRFSEQRANFIVQARKISNIKDIVINLEDEFQSRCWLARNVMGLGYKEASHFLRNVGYNDVAILDRHILRTMCKHELITVIPKTLTKNTYLRIESRLRSFGAELRVPLSKLDLYLWFMSTGEVLK